MESIRISTSDRAAAVSLAEHLLGSFVAEAVELDGRAEVEVLADRPHDRLVADVIPAVEGWLARSGRDSATVAVDGRIYTVARPVESTGGLV